MRKLLFIKNTLILLLQIVYTSLHSQGYAQQNRQMQELGVNLCFPVAVLLHFQVDGMPQYGYPIGLSYRIGTEVFQIRSILTYQKCYFENNMVPIPANSSPDSITLSYGPTIRSTDTSHIIIARKGSSNNVTLRFNLEWHYPKKYQNLYYGVCIAGGSTYIWRRNKIIVKEIYKYGDFHEYTKLDETYDDARMFNFNIGSFAGTEIALSERFNIDLHLSIEYVVYFGHKVVEFSDFQVRRIPVYKNQYDKFKVFSDISLFYRL